VHIFNLISFSFCSYGLLGASGCGKTTVLSTIVGLKKIDKGIVSIYGAMPGDRKMGIPGKRVGYMPQVK
jgi:ABC-type multidrug transport system ATPase subunit